MNILLITSNRIGDAVLSTGLVRWVQRAHPGAKLYIATSPLAKNIFENIPNLGQIYEITKQPYKKHWLKLWLQCRKTKWDIIIDLRDSIVSYVLRAPQKYRYGPKNPSHKPQHKVIQNSKILGLNQVFDPILYLSEANLQAAQKFLTEDKTGKSRKKTTTAESVSYIAISPAANWTGKRWREVNFARLINDLSSRYPSYRFVLMAGPDELAIVNKVIEDVQNPAHLINLAGCLSLMEAAAILSKCVLFVGNDSGLMHIAAAAGIPVIGLFGPSHPEIYGPWGEKCQAIRTQKSFVELTSTHGYDHKTTDSLMDSLDYTRVLIACQEKLAHQKVA